MKRFYKTATAVPEGAGWTIHLDARPAKTPLRAPLAAPNAGLAEAIAEEWRGQGERVNPLAMPLTRIACAAIDHMSVQTDARVEALLAYGETDLVCYRAEHPQSLVAKQEAAWGPVLRHAAERYDASLRVVRGVGFVEQPAQALTALRATLASRDPFTLAGVSVAVETVGSLLIALMLADGALDADTAFAAARLDEQDQAERWGVDEEAQAREDALREDMRAAGRFLGLLG